ncbi:hypothetical protein C8046_13510 [Serinibacter arcticus]|uniref:Protein kinase domain-containing protein n=1 Tax=Serinibacter arcticus TaxID=1655435 RepID=A0A2U1ZX57_9MICO|nr:protein kinase family protein [Serinibacter arcticus]PWD51523.1 hypothetical protein C8046_13510 [Serinibacter arcticus]
MNPTQEAQLEVLAARTASDLFGENDGDRSRRAALRTLRRLRAQLHPDRARAAGVDVGEATSAFVTVGDWHAAWLQDGATGARAAADGGTTAVVHGRRRDWTVGAQVAGGTWSTLYAADGAVAKIARSERANRLVAVAASSLTRLAAFAATRSWAEHGYPHLVDVGEVRGPQGRRAAVVIEDLGTGTGHVSLEQVLAAHPGGLDGRDWAWMMRRLLWLVAGAHDAGLVHGAIAPANVLIAPSDHRVVLAGWGMSTPSGGRLPARMASEAAAYPPEADGAVTGALDVWMLAHLMERMLRPDEARQRRFARGCRQTAPRMRPTAADLSAEYDDLLDRLHGPRTFRPFPMPAVARTP